MLCHTCFQKSIHSVVFLDSHDDDLKLGYSIHFVTDVSSPVKMDLLKLLTAPRHYCAKQLFYSSINSLRTL